MPDIFLSEIRSFAFNFTPKYFLPCDGRALLVAENQVLYTLIGNNFGGDETHFNLPDLRGRVPIGNGPDYPPFAQGGEETHHLTVAEMPRHRHQAVASTHAANTAVPENHFWPADAGYVMQSNGVMSDQALAKTGSGGPHSNMSPYQVVNYQIAIAGIYPSHDSEGGEELLSTIRAFPFQRPLRGWLPCDGRLLKISEHSALFSLIGDAYGGDGTTNFALPDFRGKALVNCGEPKDLTPYRAGQAAGVSTVKLTVGQMATHKHPPLASTKGNVKKPDGLVWANADTRPVIECFATEKGTGAVMNPAAIGESGGDQPHNNMMPFQALEYFIVTSGVFPSRD